MIVGSVERLAGSDIFELPDVQSRFGDSFRLSFNHPNGPKACDAVADAGLVEDADDAQDVFVGVGLFFFEARAATGPGDDAFVE
jgi:hypothetical protein